MRTAGIVAIALAAAAIGAGASGWIISSHDNARNGLSPGGTGDRSLPAVPLGDVAGAATFGGPITMPNPLGDDPAAMASGKKLFRAMNCAGCHGYDGGGGMGPSLKDHYWRYGGAPAQIYKSIYDGRPQGMPAWGRALPADQLWRLTAYVGSLGGGVPPEQAVAALHGDTVGRTVKKSQNNAAQGGNGVEGQ